MLWFFGPEACGILAPQPGIEPTPPTLEGEVSTTGPPGKSPYRVFLKWGFKPKSRYCISDFFKLSFGKLLFLCG